MDMKPRREMEDLPVDPVKAAIVQALLVIGFLAVHFGVARLW